MEPILSAIAFLNWERNLAYDLGMTHSEMKELVQKRIIPPGTSLEKAKQILKNQKSK